MNFFLTTIGSAGDVFPMLGLALQLQKSGHRVTLATNGYFQPLAAKYQIEFKELGTREQYFEAIQDPALWHPQQAFSHIFKFFQPILERQHQLLVEQAHLQPTICLSNCLGFGARTAQESHGIPVLTVHLQPAVLWSDHAPPQLANLFGPRWFKSLLYRLGEKFVLDRLLGASLNPWRKSLGLPPIKRAGRWWNSPHGVLCLFPEWYAAPQMDWPQPLLQTDFPLWNDDADQPLSEDVQAYLDAGEPPLVFTPGTANIHGRDFFAAAASACQKLNRRGVFLTRHPEQLPAPLPNLIRHMDYVPLDLLLARSAAFVHHGGIGSTSQALLAGIPQIVMPLAHDQFDNAIRVKQLHVGQSLPVKLFTADALTNMLQDLCSSPKVHSACQTIRSRLTARTGLEQAVQKIEELFATSPQAAMPLLNS